MDPKQNIIDFYDYLAKNKNVQKKLSNKIKKVSNENTAMHVITNIANKENFIFSVEELRDFVEKKSEKLGSVEDSQLGKVAGGKNEIKNDY